MKKPSVILVFILFFAAGRGNSWAYDYPFDDPYIATVIGTPAKYGATLPKKIKIKKLKLTVFDDRDIPDVFWYQEKLRYSLAYQKEKAPLIFIIAGTGASYNAYEMQRMQKAFCQAGFHVISLSSPTHPNFIVTASTTQVPGYIVQDSRDLYHVMDLAWQQVKTRIEVSEFYLTGYSLGAAQAAFISKLDEEERLFNFKKVLMINPPVCLYKSVKILDDMLISGIPGGMDNFDEFFNEFMREFSEIYKIMGYIDLSSEYLYALYRKQLTKEENLPGLIALAFRLSSTNMIFTSDVMTHAGLIIPKERILSSNDSLTDYFKVTARTGFIDYFNELFYPYFKSQRPDITQQALIEEVSLESIEGYLRTSEKVALMTNEDDLILAPGELDFLRRVFQSRAKVYPKGGHCGNMGFKDNVEYMISFFKNEGE